MSFIRNTLAVGAFSALAVAQTSTTPKLNAACADVVVFMARGNDAPYHDDRTSPFIDATCSKLKAQGKTCDYIDIEFDVTLGGDYCDQIAEGARNGISQITAFNAKCPCTHIIVNGYSEGANVVGDVLGGPGGCSFVSSGLDNTSRAGKAIAAALLWGDVRHTANQPYNVLDGANKGPYPRTGADLTRLNRYSSVLRSYCAAGDPVCAGGETVAEHLNYFELYTDAASSWAVGKIDAVAPLCPKSSSSSSVATPTATVSPSSSAPASSVSASASASGAPTASVSASSAPAVSESASASSAPAASMSAPGYSASAPAESMPTSPATVEPFPPMVPYPTGSCVQVYEVEYVYV